MSEEFVACGHQDKCLYLINTSKITWQKEFDVEKTEAFKVAKKTSLMIQLTIFDYIQQQGI